MRKYAKENNVSLPEALIELTKTPEGEKLWRDYLRSFYPAAGFISDELTIQVEQYAKENGVSLSVALGEITKTAEGQRLWKEHSRQFAVGAAIAEERQPE